MEVEFGWQDLFVVGIGCEVVGAWLVSRPLLASDAELAMRTGSFWGGNPYAVLSQINDRIRGTVGVWSLILGFILQAAAYAVTVSVDHLSRGNVAGVVIAGAVPVVLVLGATRLALPRWQVRQAIGIARYDLNDRELKDLPDAQTLQGFANALGHVRQPDVSVEDYVRNVFGVTEVRNLPDSAAES